MCQPGWRSPAGMGHQGVPKGSLGKVPGMGAPVKSCRVILAEPRASWLILAEPRASCSVLCSGHSSIFSGVLWPCCCPPGAPQLLGFLPGALQSCDRVGSIPPGRVTRWGEAGAGTRPPARAALPETRGLLVKSSACPQISASCALTEPSVPGQEELGCPRAPALRSHSTLSTREDGGSCPLTCTVWVPSVTVTRRG